MPPPTKRVISEPLDEVDDLGPDAEPCGDARRLVLGGAVDAEELGVRARDPQDERIRRPRGRRSCGS